MFLGLYNYTTYLTYLNLISGFSGIGFSVYNHYYYALVCLLISGVCDMFDGLVSRTKKNRSYFEKKYGIQIDSLADMISFGVLPVFVNYSLIKSLKLNLLLLFIFWLFWSFYVLAALIRLAYYNVLTEMPNNSQKNTFIGLPVTTSAVIFPFLGFIRIILKSLNPRLGPKKFYFWVHFGCIIILIFLFLCKKIRIPKIKPKKTIIITTFSGLLWILFFIVFKSWKKG